MLHDPTVLPYNRERTPLLNLRSPRISLRVSNVPVVCVASPTVCDSVFCPCACASDVPQGLHSPSPIPPLPSTSQVISSPFHPDFTLHYGHAGNHAHHMIFPVRVRHVLCQPETSSLRLINPVEGPSKTSCCMKRGCPRAAKRVCEYAHLAGLA